MHDFTDRNSYKSLNSVKHVKLAYIVVIPGGHLTCIGDPAYIRDLACKLKVLRYYWITPESTSVL